MAAGRVLRMEFTNSEGNKFKMNWKYAKTANDLAAQTIAAFAQTLITNGDIFRMPNVPSTFNGATLITTTEQEYDFSE